MGLEKLKERNKEIVLRIKSGETQIKIAKDFNLSPARIGQIKARAKRDEKIQATHDMVVASSNPKLVFNPVLFKNILELELSVRTQNCLTNDMITYIGDLVQKKEWELLRIPNFGMKGIYELKVILPAMGLHLGMEIKGWEKEKQKENNNGHE